MTTVIEQAAAPARPHGITQERLWTGLRCGVLAGFVLLIAAALVWGRHHTSYQNLENHLKSGAVQEVTVFDTLPPGATGVSHPVIVWDTGSFTQETTVEQLSGGDQQAQSSEPGTRHIVGDVGDALRRIEPNLQVHERSDDGSRLGGQIMSWSIPGWCAVLASILMFATVGLLYGGPEPRFATRWAWFWLIFSPASLIAAMAYLIFAPGKNPDDNARRRSRRITGGWAFVLVLLFLGGTGFSYGG